MWRDEHMAGGRTREGLILVILSLTASCSSMSRMSHTTGDLSHDLVTRDQLDARDKDALEVIRRLRPSWLTPRGRTSLSDGQSYAAVFVDDVLYGSVESLRGISSDDIYRIYFMGATDATTRYGTGYPAGIIHVQTVR